MISIVIPVYNQADKIEKTLQSILKQSYQNVEVVVVNDGSSDNIKEILKKWKAFFKEKKIKLQIISQENRGAANARNRGFQETKGEFVLFLDADVVMKKDMLSKMLSVLKKNPDKAYAYSAHKFGRKLFKLWKFDIQKLKEIPYIHTSSLIRRNRFPGFDENLKRFQDWDLWLTMLKRGDYGVYIPEVLFEIKSGGTMSSWLPSFFYKFFPFLKKVKDYKKAMKIIKKKHKI